MVVGEIHIPMGINPYTGRRRYTEDQLSYLKPRWRRQWEEYSDLDEDQITYLINKYHCGPFEYPGTRIAEGVGRGMNKFLKEAAYEWRGKGKSSSQIYREARRRLINHMRAEAVARGMDEDDPASGEYFLTQAQRMRIRKSIYDAE